MKEENCIFIISLKLEFLASSLSFKVFPQHHYVTPRLCHSELTVSLLFPALPLPYPCPPLAESWGHPKGGVCNGGLSDSDDRVWGQGTEILLDVS